MQSIVKNILIAHSQIILYKNSQIIYIRILKFERNLAESPNAARFLTIDHQPPSPPINFYTGKLTKKKLLKIINTSDTSIFTSKKIRFTRNTSKRPFSLPYLNRRIAPTQNCTNEIKKVFMMLILG